LGTSKLIRHVIDSKGQPACARKIGLELKSIDT